MPAQIFDLTTVRLTRDLNAMKARSHHVRDLANRQRDACRRAASQLEDLRDGLDGFAARLAPISPQLRGHFWSPASRYRGAGKQGHRPHDRCP